MHSPVLTQRPSEEGQHVLVLEENDLTIDHWFSTIFVEVVRAGTEQPNITFKVHLTVYCQVLDLIVAFEHYLVGIVKPSLYYNDSQVSRDKWLGEGINGATLILAEEGAERGEGGASMEVSESHNSTTMKFLQRPFEINLSVNVPPPPPGTKTIEEEEEEDNINLVHLLEGDTSFKSGDVSSHSSLGTLPSEKTENHAITQHQAFDSFESFVSECPVLDNTPTKEKQPPSLPTKPEEQKKEEPPPEVQPAKKKGKNARLRLGNRAKKAKMGDGGGGAVKQPSNQPAEKVIKKRERGWGDTSSDEEECVGCGQDLHGDGSHWCTTCNKKSHLKCLKNVMGKGTYLLGVCKTCYEASTPPPK